MVVSSGLPWRNVVAQQGPMLALITASTALALVLDRLAGVRLPSTATPYSIAGVALSILLGFRNNAAYDRWWEGRKLWGGIINASRALGRQIMTYPRANGEVTADEVKRLQAEVLHRHVAWLNALRRQLRGQDPLGEISGLVPAEETGALAAEKNVALALLQTNGARLTHAANRGALDERRLESIDRTLTELVAMQGACERLKSTPIPGPYTFFTAAFLRLFCCALPFGLVEPLGFATALVVLAVSVMFLVLGSIGRMLEDPFSTGPHALALSAICRTVEINLRQMLGEADLPDPIQPVRIRSLEVLS